MQRYPSLKRKIYVSRLRIHIDLLDRATYSNRRRLSGFVIETKLSLFMDYDKLRT